MLEINGQAITNYDNFSEKYNIAFLAMEMDVKMQ